MFLRLFIALLLVKFTGAAWWWWIIVFFLWIAEIRHEIQLEENIKLLDNKLIIIGTFLHKKFGEENNGEEIHSSEHDVQ